MQIFRNLTIVALTAFLLTSCEKEPPPVVKAPAPTKAKPERSSASSSSVLSNKKKQEVGKFGSSDSGLGSTTLKQGDMKKTNKENSGSSLSPNNKMGKENKTMLQGTR